MNAKPRLTRKQLGVRLRERGYPIGDSTLTLDQITGVQDAS